jgi:phage-related protein
MDVFDLYASLKLDKKGYESDLKDAESKAGGFGSRISGGLKVAGKASAAALGATATGIGALVKNSVTAYSDTEQLVGGVEKLYGKAADKVIKYANNAYKTSGVSANEYMDTATQFSASLISSLKGNTQAAAKQTDVAMRAISDNVNVFGTNTEDVTNAFKGFSKQNYTMLDNLKLGYGGTKDEMQRLIEDANAWGKANGEASNLSIDSFSDIVTAIQQIQEKQNIAGTTQKEASDTIQGSLAMTKSAWDNLIAGLTDPQANIGSLIDNVVKSVGDLGKNLQPAISRALEGVGQLLTKSAPMIAQTFPEIATKLIPPLISTAIQVLGTLAAQLPSILSTFQQTIVETLKQVGDKIGQENPLLGSIFNGIADAIPKISAIIKPLLPVIGALMGSFAVTKGIQSFVGALTGVIGGVKSVVGAVKGAIGAFKVINMVLSLTTGVGLLPMIGIIAGVVAAVIGVIEVVKHWGQISEWLKNVWRSVSDAASNIWNSIKSAIISVVNGISEHIHSIFSGIKNFISNIWNGIKSVITGIINGIKNHIVNGFTNAVNGIKSVLGRVTSVVKNGFEGAVNFIKSLPSKALTWGKDMIESFVNGIKWKIGKVTSAVKGIASKIKSFLHFSEPDEGPLKDFHTYAPDMMKTFASGIKSNQKVVINSLNDTTNKMRKLMKGIELYSPKKYNSSIKRVKTLVDKIKEADKKLNIADTKKQKTAIMSGMKSDSVKLKKLMAKIDTSSSKANKNGKNTSLFSDILGRMEKTNNRMGKTLSAASENKKQVPETSNRKGIIGNAVGSVLDKYNALKEQSKSNFEQQMKPSFVGAGNATNIADVNGYSGQAIGDIVIPVYIGSEKIDEIIVDAIRRKNFRSGGR